MYLNQKELAELKQLIHKKQRQIEDSLVEMKKSSKPVNLDGSFGRLSRMDALQQQQMALNNQLHLEKELKQLKASQNRIDQGVYGYCLQCEEPIGFKRLCVKPEVLLCFACSKAQEVP
tara:strand:+ start:13219 stop:13572 length:354 start_codon:yes stop_codon:yes gene_type:complete